MRLSSLSNAFIYVTISTGLVEAFQPLLLAKTASSSPSLAVARRQDLRTINHRHGHNLSSSSFCLSSLSSISSSSVTDYTVRNQNTSVTVVKATRTSRTTLDSSEETQQRADTPSPQEQTVPVASVNKKTPSKKNPVIVATTIEELLSVLNGDDDSNEDISLPVSSTSSLSSSMTLILFHAHYCKICQRAGMQLIRVAKEYPSIRLAKIEASVFPEPAADKLKSLGVTKFPFIQIYRNGQCVASFSTGPTHMFMRKIRDTLDLCLDRDDECWDNFVAEFSAEIKSNQLARKNLLSRHFDDK